MPRYERDTVQLIEDLQAALADLRAATRATEVTVRRALKMAKDGADVSTALTATKPAETRQAMNDALKAVEAARHQMRLRIFAEGLAQGMTIGNLGRIFGFSRQLAARYAKEARGIAST